MAEKAMTEKLGLKPGYTIFTIGGGDWLLEEIGEAIGEEGMLFALDSPKVLERAQAIGEADAILFWVGQTEGLRLTLEMLRERVKENGAIWAIITKKAYQEKEGLPGVKETDVIEAAKGAGLVDVKVASLSEKECALKLAIPRQLRRER
jgi:hypothetical protein